MLYTILLLMVVGLILYIVYKILKRINELEKKINEVSFISRQQTNSVTRTLINYLKEKNIFNARQVEIIEGEINKIYIRSERQLEGVYKDELDEIFKVKK